MTLTDTDTAATIYYTTDGSTPTAASKQYTGPITVEVSQTINAIALDPNLTNSDITSAAFVILAGLQINFSNGFSTTTGLTFNGTTAVDDTRLQLTDGNLNEAGSVFWNTPVNVQAFTTNFTFQLSSPTPAQMANGFTFTIQNDAPTALGGDSAGLGYQDIPKSVAVKFNFYNYENEGSDSTGLYTDGEAPVNPTVDISSSGVILNSGDNINAQITYDGTTLTLTLSDPLLNKTFNYSWPINIPQFVVGNTAYVGFTGGAGGLSASQKLISWTYVTQALPPAFSVAAGTYTTVQNVSLTSATADATIYYTTDGSTPTGGSGSTAYTGPIPVGASETIQAVAISPTVGTSIVESAAYVISLQTAPGTFSLSGTPPAAIMQGGAATSPITVAPSGGFTGNVTLSCAVTSSPAGAAGTPGCSVTQPAAITGTGSAMAALSFATQSTTSPGTYSVTVTGTSASLVETTTVPMLVSSPAVTPNFTLSGTAVSVNAGTNGTSTVTIAPTGGFLGSVALTCAVTGPAGASNLPTCSAAQPAAISGTSSVTAALTVSTQAATTAGSYTVTVTGKSPSLTQTATVAATVTAAVPPPTPEFALTGTSVDCCGSRYARNFNHHDYAQRRLCRKRGSGLQPDVIPGRRDRTADMLRHPARGDFRHVGGHRNAHHQYDGEFHCGDAQPAVADIWSRRRDNGGGGLFRGAVPQAEMADHAWATSAVRRFHGGHGVRRCFHVDPSAERRNYCRGLCGHGYRDERHNHPDCEGSRHGAVRTGLK